MDRPATAHPASAREIILEIVRNMRDGLEPLHYSTLAPAIFHVYLHADDMERLRGILPRIIDEARRALDAELEALNRASIAERLKLARRSDPKIVAPEGGWQIRILENTDEDAAQGDIVISSELALPAKDEFGSGSMTKRIATRRMGGVESTRQSYEAAGSGTTPGGVLPDGRGSDRGDGRGANRSDGRGGVGGVLPDDRGPERGDGRGPNKGGDQGDDRGDEPGGDRGASFAVIEYDDNSGRKTYRMAKDEIVVGRGGRDYWTDIKLETLPDVSREHFRLRRDPASGQFFLKDLSRLGTTINGEKAPSSIEFEGSEKRDRNLEAPVPAHARIGLAGVLFLEFRSTTNG